MKLRLKLNERCPIPAHNGSRTCCGRGDIVRIKTRHDVTRKMVGLGTYLLPDGRIERDKAAKRRLKDKFLRAGRGCAACDRTWEHFDEIELAHIESCGMNGHKRDDAEENLTLMHRDENREQGSRSLAEYLADPKRIGLKGKTDERSGSFADTAAEL